MKALPIHLRQHWPEHLRLPAFLQTVKDDLLGRGLNGDTAQGKPLPGGPPAGRKAIVDRRN